MIELEFDKDIRTVIKTVCRLFKKLEKSGMTNVTYRLGRYIKDLNETSRDIKM